MRTLRGLSALRIGNFKAFADTQRIPLKPITLVFGPNSAGKSSFIQSLAFAHEVQFGRPKRDRSPLDVYKTEIGGAAIDLGGFTEFVHRHESERLVEWGADVAFAALTCMPEGEFSALEVSVSCLIGLAPENNERYYPDSATSERVAPRIRAVSLDLGGDGFLKASYRYTNLAGSARLRVETLNMAHAEVRRLLHWAVDQAAARGQRTSVAALRDGVSSRLGECMLEVKRLFGFGLAAPGMTDEFGNPLDELETPNIDIPIAEQAFWSALDGLVKEIGTEVGGQFRQLEYLGPIRALPPRHFTPGDFEDSEWNAGGGQAWDQICRDVAVREAVNQWLSKPEMKTPYRLKVRELVDPDDLESALVAEFCKEQVERQPMSALERRELLTKELAEAYAELNERYGENQVLAKEATKLVETWHGRLVLARSPLDREQILQEADAALERWDQDACDQLSESDDEDLVPEVLDEEEVIDAAHFKAASFTQRLKAAELVKKTPQLALHDVRKKIDVSHRDVGTGISQVLPVLVAAFGSYDQIIAMEQPEIHLHPALQAELGDAFIESALGGRQNTFILETHSEHLILRLLRRIRETTNGELPDGIHPVRREDVQIIFVQPDASGSRFVELPVDSDGEFVEPWPGGFFPERAKELF